MSPLLELYEESGISFLDITDEMIAKEERPYIPDLDINKTEMIKLCEKSKKRILFYYSKYRRALVNKKKEEQNRANMKLENEIADLQYLLTPYIQNYDLK